MGRVGGFQNQVLSASKAMMLRDALIDGNRVIDRALDDYALCIILL